MSRMRWIAVGVAPVLAAVVALSLAAGLPAATVVTTSTLQLSASVRSLYRFNDAYCPPGTPAVADCVRFVGGSEVPGLGRLTATYTKVLPNDDPACPVIQFNAALLEVAGKGTLEVTRDGRLCGPTAPAVVGPFGYTITRGTGTYAGATGTLQFGSAVTAIDGGCQCGTSSDTWTGTLTVSGVEFDVSAPTIRGAASKTVRVSTKAKRVRVRYAITASDAVDGTVPAVCEPRSGSFFSLGRTKVACSATDSSGNTAKAQFTVLVKRTR